MKKFPLIPFVFFLGLIVVFFACNQNNKPKNSDETILKGSTSVLVDETLLPIVEDQVEGGEHDVHTTDLRFAILRDTPTRSTDLVFPVSSSTSTRVVSMFSYLNQFIMSVYP